MIQLFIEDREVELKDDLLISFNYETIDPDNLSKIKNSFSKTVDIPGTSNNNAIFGDLFRIDRYVPSTTIEQQLSGTKNIGFQFDPHKRAEFLLLSNGSLINSGYCILTNIVVKNEVDITYKITLYGGIGNFFYNLSYNEDGTNKTLNDLFWNWKRKLGLIGNGEPLNREDENNIDNYLYNASTSIVSNSYHKLKPIEEIFEADSSYQGRDSYWNDEYERPYPITDIDKDIVFVPCYTGNYEDFDSNKMLLSVFNFNYDDTLYNPQTLASLRNMFPNSFLDYSDDPDNPTEYNALNSALETFGAYKYGIVKFSRDLDPFEAGDLRVNEMPVAIRLSKLLRTLSMPWNNGGYNVDWDEEITNSPYWNYSWVMLGKMNQEKDDIDIPNVEIDTTSNDEVLTLLWNDDENRDPTININLPIMDETSYTDDIITVNDFEKGRYVFKINAKLYADFVARYYDEGWNKFYNRKGYKLANCSYFKTETTEKYRKNVYALIYNIYSDNVKIKTCADFIFFSESSIMNLTNDDVQTLKNRLETYYNTTINEYKYYNINSGEVEVDEDTELGHFFSDNIQISHNFENDVTSTLRIEQIKNTMYVDLLNGDYKAGIWGVDNSQSNFFDIYFWGLYDMSKNTIKPLWPWSGNFNDYEDFNYTFSIQDSSYNGVYVTSFSGFESMKINKRTLFANSQSPFKYLSDLIKMMNWRIVYDEQNKNVSIMPLKKYYKNITTDIENLVDYSRDINIKNITTDYKSIDFGLSELESYPVSLFNRKSKKKFNVYHYDTLIEYNNQTNKLLNDSIYKNTLDWQQNSLFYNVIPQVPRAGNTPSISWNLFNISSDNDEKIKEGEKVTVGINSNQQSLFTKNDFMPKMSFFDKDNKYTGNDTVLMFLNGFVKNYDYNKVNTEPVWSNPVTINYDSIVEDNVVVRTTGTYSSSAAHNVFIYNNINPSNKYYFTGSRDVAGSTANYYVNYFNGTTIVGYECPSTTLSFSDYLLTVPSNCDTIKINVKKTTQSTYHLDVSVPVDKYVISPRINLSEDTYEQYFFNNNRCYLYDFKYNDNFTSWGSWSSDQKGSANSWVLPFFTRELYNNFITHETEEYETIRLDVSRTYDNSKFLGDGTVASNTDWCQYEFVFPQEDENTEIVSARFTAKYPSTESGWATWEMTRGYGTIRYEGNFTTTGQHEFIDAAISMSPDEYGNKTQIVRLNTYKPMQADDNYFVEVTIKRINYYYDWDSNNEIVASWNLVNQNQAEIYNLNNTSFIKDPEFEYSKIKNEITGVENNEYNVNLSSYDYSSVFSENWEDYMYDLYDRNTRDVTLYLDLTSLGNSNEILRRIYSWKGFLWVITKIENRQVEQIGKDKFTKCTIHKIKNLNTWTNN